MGAEYVYKKADQDWEFAEIARLNYETFVEEIPQHSPNPSRCLEDPFHAENQYFICLKDRNLLGMIAIRTQRPFSLDKKLGDVYRYFPVGTRLLETRLLSVIPALRNGPIASNLLTWAGSFLMEGEFDAMIISGTTRQKKMYRKLGFLPFGPSVGSKNASFQPMYLTPERIRLHVPEFMQEKAWSFPIGKFANFLPGPINHDSSVRTAMAHPAVSHRGLDYRLLLNRAHWLLHGLTGARHSQILFGSGTLANDVVGGQLLQQNGKGLILVNGEFGRRLINAANGFRLAFETIEVPWGQEFDYGMINQFLLDHPDIKWVWMTHLETSSGVLNQPARFRETVQTTGLKICLDCVSSIGNVPTDLSWVFLASGVAGKGIGAHTGLALVFFNHEIEEPTVPVPEYVNLFRYQEHDSIPFSGSSNLLHSLVQGLENLELPGKSARIRAVVDRAADLLRERGFEIPNRNGSGSVILNLSMPRGLPSFPIGEAMERRGYLLHYKSRYLRERNQIQICFMTEECLPYVDTMLNQLLALTHGEEKDQKT